MTPNDEFVPMDHINRILHFWWLVLVFAIIGGSAGFIVHRLRPPLYEAKAVFMASIDFNKVDFMHPPAPTPAPYKLTQYDEDLTLTVVQSTLVQVIPQVAAFALQNGFPLDATSLLSFSTIERQHAYWTLSFHYQDPVVVQKIVNYWAQIVYSSFQSKQNAGQVPAYLVYDLIQLAELPRTPTYFSTNVIVLAGTAIGLVLGLLVVNLPFFKPGQDR